MVSGPSTSQDATAGPWRIGQDHFGKERIYSTAGYEVARALALQGRRRLGGSERLANRKLIAAAPDLLAVLETFVATETSAKYACHYCGYDPHTEGCLVGRAEAAIAKARGEG